MKQGNIFGDKIFYGKLWKLTVPIAVQSLMLASVAAADAIDARTCGTKCDGGGFVGDTDPVYPKYGAGSDRGRSGDIGSAVLGKGDKKTINDLFCMSIRLAGVTSILFFIGCIFFPRWLMLLSLPMKKC